MNNQIYDNTILSAPFKPAASRKIWVTIILLVAALVYSCLHAIRALVITWSVQDIYSYGFLVPLITLIWIWHERDSLSQIPVKPSFISGIIVLMTGSLMLALGEVSSAAIVQEFSIVVIIHGLILMLLGAQFYLALLFPLSYLILMVPFLDSFIEKLHEPFQLFAATIAVKLLNFLNIPVFRSGQFIEMPNITLEVANACSGVRFLLSTLVLCIPLAFITQKGWVKRVLLFFFAIIISICSNPIRVALVAMWAYYGDGDIHGPLHIFQGYVVYVFGMVILFLGAWGLQKMPLPAKRSNERTGGTLVREFSDFNKFNKSVAIALVMLMSLGSYIHLIKAKPVPLKASLNGLPVLIGEWKHIGMEREVPSLSLPGADEELTRVYRNASGREVKLQIAYFESQRQDKKLVYYKLETLYENSEEVILPWYSNHTARVNKKVFHDGSQDIVVLSWYDLNGHIVANRYMAKLFIALNGLIHRQTNGAFIAISSLSFPGEREKAVRDEAEFVQSLFPVLNNFIP